VHRHHPSSVSNPVCPLPSVCFVSFRFVERRELTTTTGVDDGSWEREREDKIDNRTRGVSRALKRTNERDEHDARVETFGLR